MSLFSLLLSSLIACGEKTSDTADSSDTNSSTETDTEEEVNPDAPVIADGDAWCFTVGGSTEGDQWGFSFTFSDAQTVENVPRLQTDGIKVLNASGFEVSSHDPVCDWNTNICSAYLFTNDVGQGCDQATSTTIEYQITDADGNLSNKLSFTGRVGEGFEG